MVRATTKPRRCGGDAKYGRGDGPRFNLAGIHCNGRERPIGRRLPRPIRIAGRVTEYRLVQTSRGKGAAARIRFARPCAKAAKGRDE